MSVVYLTNDLLFSSRVVAFGRSIGVAVTMVRSRSAMLEQVAAVRPGRVFVDLEHPDADVRALLDELSLVEPRPGVVVYGPHVKASLLAAAQQAGCDLVLSRGQFDQQFSAVLTQLAQSDAQP